MIAILAFGDVVSSNDVVVDLVLFPKIVDKSLGNTKQATTLITVNNIASTTSIGNHPCGRIGGLCFQLQA